MKEKAPASPGDEITKYSKCLKPQFSAICDMLRQEIDRVLAKSTSRIYYSMPVWFIDENPIVGYNAASKHVNLLFWSGQSFGEPGLVAAGKFKAAQKKYRSVEEIDRESLRRWLEESQTTIWDYKNLRNNAGKLVRL